MGEGALRALEAAESAFWEAFGLELRLDAGRAPESAGSRELLAFGGRLRNLATARRLLWALGRLDRYADFGQGRAGAGLALLLDRIELARDDYRRGAGPLPQHLGYFLPMLLAEGRRWKHTWAPRHKAAREAAGTRAPRARKPFKRKPALGQDPKTLPARRSLGRAANPSPAGASSAPPAPLARRRAEGLAYQAAWEAAEAAKETGS